MGLVHGPAELLPVSSSGHLVLLGSRDKSFEVFAHAGTAAAMLVVLPPPRLRPLTVIPAALAGLAFERPIEERLGRRAVARAQIIGGLGLLVADAAPERRSAVGTRDELLIGVAQAFALIPGVSRNGATLTAARLLGLRRDAAGRLSREAAVPLIAGATALKLFRLRGARPSRTHFAGFAAAFVSGAAAARLAPRVDGLPSYAPFAIYRIVLGAIALRLMRLNGRHG
jgi:undecaprenyl-diphosphatase